MIPDCECEGQLSTEEQKAIVAGFANSDQVRANGIRAGGQKFFTLNAEPERIYGKKQVRELFTSLSLSYAHRHILLH